MLKRIAMACAILITSTCAFAQSSVYYIGADLGLDYGNWKFKDVSGISRTLSANGTFGNLFMGAGETYQKLYIGLEIFGNESSTRTDTVVINTSTVQASDKTRMRWTYGLSLLPGIRFSEAALMYIRLSGLRSRFDVHQTVVPSTATSNIDKEMATGGQVGLGFQGTINCNWGFRAEYDYNAYHTFSSFGNKITASDNQVKLGVLYFFY